MNIRDVTLVFCSCDAYSDLWDNFFRLLKKYWPEFDGEIILNTESKKCEYDGFCISEPLNCPDGTSWSDRLSMSLKKAKTPYVLIMLEDYYLKSPVDHSGFLRTLEYMKSRTDAMSVTYLCEPGAHKPIDDLPGFFKRKHFSLYKLTGHITLYKKDFLLSMLRHNESAWEFEVNGTIRAWFQKGKFLSPKNNEHEIFPYDFGVLITRGKFDRALKEYFEENENCVFLKDRPSMKFEFKPSGGIMIKAKYFFKGVLSIFKEKAL